MDRRIATLRARLGSRIRALRRAQRISQEQLAARAGLSYKFVGEVERGVGNPTVGTLAAVSTALGVDVPELFGAPSGRQAGSPLLLIPKQDWDQVRAATETLARVVSKRDGPVRSGAPRK